MNETELSPQIAELEEWNHTFGDIINLSQEIVHEWMKKVDTNYKGDWQEMSQPLQIMMHQALQKPGVLFMQQLKWFQECLSVFQENSKLWLGHTSEQPVAEKPQDKRFRSKTWQEHPLYKTLMQQYLITVKYTQEWVVEQSALDEKTKKRVSFLVRQLMDALSPTNFVTTNPDIYQMTLTTRGKNLVSGLRNMLQDIKRSKEAFSIKMTDETAFEVGRNVATTKGEVVFENELFQLIQYYPTTKTVYKTPLLIVPPWINKYYILDLSEKNSFVKYAVDQGHTVFIISWVNPDERFRDFDFEDYMLKGAYIAVKQVLAICQVKQANTVGFCIGGTLLSCLMSYLSAHQENIIASATFFATLLDFSEPGELGVFIDESQIQAIETKMQQKGYLDGSHMATVFNLLRDKDLIWKYFTNNYLAGKEPAAFDLLYWNCDSTNMPEKMHSYYLRKMYLQNLLAKPGGLVMNDTPIDLSNITVPSYFISTEQDHIAPWQSTYQGACLLGGETTFVLGGSGHIAGIINPPEQEKYYYRVTDHKTLPQTPTQWSEFTQEYKGSWWPHWLQWVVTFSGKKSTKRTIESKRIIEAAPGSYVQRKSKNDNRTVRPEKEEIV